MQKINNLFLLIFFTVVLSASAQDSLKTNSKTITTVNEFWKQMDDVFNDPAFSNAHWGVVIQSLETGEYLYKKNEDKLFMPASNMKLFTTSSALSLLGSDYKFKTGIYSRGSLDGSTLKGDIIIKGSGDPTLSGRFFNNDMLKLFNDWADSLLKRGIDEISGNIIGDDNAFDDNGFGRGWSWDYESDWYAAPSGALSFNENCVDIIIAADKNNNSKVTIIPDTKYTTVINNVSVVDYDSSTSISVFRERNTNVITVEGTIKQNDSIKTYCTVNNPTQFTVVVLKNVLEEKGIKVSGYPMDIDDMSAGVDYNSTKLLFTYTSPELKELVRVVNKNSNNFYAEQLLKTIGLESEKYGSIETGSEAAMSAFEDMGIVPNSLNIADGSGLSRSNLITPNQVVSILKYMYNSKNFTSFYNSLPIAGVDGTISRRMKNTAAENNVRAKTGYIGNVRSLSGYVYTANNEPIVFSMIANNFLVPVKLAENIQDLVCLRLANFKRK